MISSETTRKIPEVASAVTPGWRGNIQSQLRSGVMRMRNIESGTHHFAKRTHARKTSSRRNNAKRERAVQA